MSEETPMNTDDRALADLIARLTEALDFDAQAGTDGQWSRLMAEATNARDRLEAFHAKPVVGEARNLGDFRCHNCKRVVQNIAVAPERCPDCRCRDFSACAPSTPPVVEEGRREAIERGIRIAIWNAGKWQGKPDEVAQSLIRKAMAEPTMIRALSALSTPVAAQGDEVREGIYVASRASIPERGQMWRDLRACGVQINSSWIDEDGEGETADWSELWTRIEAEVKRSRALILYAEPSDFPLKGAFVEAGIAIAAGIPVFIVAPGVELGSYGCRPIGSWASHPLVSYATTIDAALATLGAPHEG